MIQMIFFKECRNIINTDHPELDKSNKTMLAGAITNEIFGCHNPNEQYLSFHNQHQGIIEQELLQVGAKLPHMRDPLTDALRIQTLCDDQEGTDSTHVLSQASSFGFLAADRELPLPSAFMETVRALGAKHKLIVPPVAINATEEQDLLHQAPSNKLS